MVPKIEPWCPSLHVGMKEDLLTLDETDDPEIKPNILPKIDSVWPNFHICMKDDVLTPTPDQTNYHEVESYLIPKTDPFWPNLHVGMKEDLMTPTLDQENNPEIKSLMSEIDLEIPSPEGKSSHAYIFLSNPLLFRAHVENLKTWIQGVILLNYYPISIYLLYREESFV